MKIIKSYLFTEIKKIYVICEINIIKMLIDISTFILSFTSS